MDYSILCLLCSSVWCLIWVLCSLELASRRHSFLRSHDATLGLICRLAALQRAQSVPALAAAEIKRFVGENDLQSGEELRRIALRARLDMKRDMWSTIYKQLLLPAAQAGQAHADFSYGSAEYLHKRCGMSHVKIYPYVTFRDMRDTAADHNVDLSVPGPLGLLYRALGRPLEIFFDDVLSVRLEWPWPSVCTFSWQGR